MYCSVLCFKYKPKTIVVQVLLKVIVFLLIMLYSIDRGRMILHVTDNYKVYRRSRQEFLNISHAMNI